MKKIILLMTYAVVAVSLSGCMKSPNGGSSNRGGGNSPIETIVPQDFDWKNTQDIVLSGSIDDTFSGRYLYRVDVFTENPIVNPEAKLIKGISTNSSFRLPLTVPKGVQTLYVRQRDPRARQRVQTVHVTGSEINVSFSGEAKSSLSAKGAKGKTVASIVIPSTPSNAEVISGSKEVKLETGSVYVIPKGVVYTGELQFPGQGNVALFVEGEWIYAQKNTTFQKDVNVVVQPTGVVTSSVASKVSFVGNASLKVAFGGTFDVQNMELAISDAEASILNAGNMYLSDVNYSNNATLINEGTIKIGGKLSSNNGTVIENSGTIVADALNFVGGTINNNSMMEFDELYINSNNAVFNNYATLLINAEATIKNATFNNFCYVKAADGSEVKIQGTTFNNGNNTLFSCYDVELAGGKTILNIGSQSMFDVRNKIEMGSNQNLIKGKGKDVSLARMNTVELKGWESVFYDNLQVEVFKHTQNASEWDRKYVLENNASMVAWGASMVVIPKNECSGEGNTPGGGSGSEGDQDGDVVYDQAYTYIMEDNWPHMGDYDMNDVVIELSSYVESMTNKTLVFNFKLLNVGATKTLGAGLQLDGISLAQIERVVSVGGVVEDNQKNVVIPLFINGHSLLGVQTGKPSGAVQPKEIKVEVTFKNAEDITAFKISALNLFITTTDKATAGKRKEIHLCGYAPTDKMDVMLFGQGDDNSNVFYYKSVENFVWGIMVPAKFIYPKEGANISLAYPDFTTWVASGGSQAPDWYKNRDAKYTD